MVVSTSARPWSPPPADGRTHSRNSARSSVSTYRSTQPTASSFGWASQAQDRWFGVQRVSVRRQFHLGVVAGLVVGHPPVELGQ
jgi:hypothetical protein